MTHTAPSFRMILTLTNDYGWCRDHLRQPGEDPRRLALLGPPAADRERSALSTIICFSLHERSPGSRHEVLGAQTVAGFDFVSKNKGTSDFVYVHRLGSP